MKAPYVYGKLTSGVFFGKICTHRGHFLLQPDKKYVQSLQVYPVKFPKIFLCGDVKIVS